MAYTNRISVDHLLGLIWDEKGVDHILTSLQMLTFKPTKVWNGIQELEGGLGIQPTPPPKKNIIAIWRNLSAFLSGNKATEQGNKMLFCSCGKLLESCPFSLAHTIFFKDSLPTPPHVFQPFSKILLWSASTKTSRWQSAKPHFDRQAAFLPFSEIAQSKTMSSSLTNWNSPNVTGLESDLDTSGD